MNTLLKDLKETIAGVIDDYLYNKISQADIDSDTEFDIYQETEKVIKNIQEELEDLDDEIDTHIEQMNEPSDEEYYLREDIKQRLRDLA